MIMEDLPAYTPQALSDILPIYHPQNAHGQLLTYRLCQSSSSTQILALSEDSLPDSEPYEIKSHKTGGFMNRKPHVVISASNDGQQIAEGRFDIHGTGTTISYSKSGPQRIELEHSLSQLLRTTINGTDHWWQPHPGNKDVLELKNEMEEIVARFTYTASLAQRLGNTTPVHDSRKQRMSVELGLLHVTETLAGDASGREEILCSAILVIERAKRRAANMMKSGPALKGPAAWGMSISPPGGFV